MANESLNDVLEYHRIVARVHATRLEMAETAFLRERDKKRKSIGFACYTARQLGDHTLTKMACWMKMPASKLKKMEEGELDLPKAWLDKYFAVLRAAKCK